MKCAICNNAIIPAGQPCPTACGDDYCDHVFRCSPVQRDLCLGCWMASIDLDKWLTRIGIRAPMGNWTPGWLRAIMEDPRKYL